MPTCTACKDSVSTLYYHYCVHCYEHMVKTRGELPLIVESYMDGPTKYVYNDVDKVHAHFYRIKRVNGELVVHINERQWCLELFYKDGFPCPPIIKFVNPYNYDDDNPIWWPKTQFFTDPINQKFDLPFIADKSAHRSGLSRGDLSKMKPMTAKQYNKSRAARKKSYDTYLQQYSEKLKRIAVASNLEAHTLLGHKWSPASYVATFASKLETPKLF